MNLNILYFTFSSSTKSIRITRILLLLVSVFIHHSCFAQRHFESTCTSETYKLGKKLSFTSVLINLLTTVIDAAPPPRRSLSHLSKTLAGFYHS